MIEDVPLKTPPDEFPEANASTVKEAIESVGAQVLSFPPYRPDYHPMENVFSKWKTWGHKAK